jgi:AcrR family transcriptional regulator
MEGWFDEITLEKVAAAAGVTVQTVVRRFGGKEGLLEAAAEEMGRQIRGRRATAPGDVERMVKHLVADYEQTGDAVVRLLALEPRHPFMKVLLDYGRREHRRWVTEGLSEALEGASGAARERAVDELVIVTDVYTWKLLRRDMGRSVAATQATMAGMVRGVIAGFSK